MLLLKLKEYNKLFIYLENLSKKLLIFPVSGGGRICPWDPISVFHEDERNFLTQRRMSKNGIQIIFI